MNTQDHTDEAVQDSHSRRRTSRFTIGLIAGAAVLLAAGAIADVLRPALFFVHVVSVAVLGGGLLMQVRRAEKTVNRLMRDGACTAFAAGPLLVASIMEDGGSVNPTKIAVKGAIGLAILVLVLARYRRDRVASPLWALLLLLWVINVCVAIIW